VTKQGFVYVFDRVTGRPLWPIEERPVSQSTVPGEKSSRTQPFPTKPAPFDRQGISENDVVDFTPELRKEALTVLARYNYGPLYTPPSIEKPTIQMPGWAGGASWAGAACDPETGIMYLPSITSPLVITMVNRPPRSTAPYVGVPAPMETLQGVPLWNPPYGRITAIDLNTGDHRWMVPMGDLAQSNPVLKQLGLPPVGRAARGHVLLTRTLLIIAQEGTTQRESAALRKASPEPGTVSVPTFEVHDPKLVAYDKRTGKIVGEVALPRNATGAPMTYMLNGKQFVIIPTGGANLPAELVALHLP
jgi:quinoprotein glucose dehydrogenase